jgi:hypothetical protein
MTMTLAEFRAAGTDCADLGRALSDALWTEEGYIGIGRSYPGNLWIERMPDNWLLNPDAAGKWYLLIYRDHWLSDNLSELEERLYNFGVDEGYFDDDPGANCGEPLEPASRRGSGDRARIPLPWCS